MRNDLIASLTLFLSIYEYCMINIDEY